MIAPVAGGVGRQDHGGWTGGVAYAGENHMCDIDSELATAARYVAEARRIVAWQRARILKLKAADGATPDHELTLQASVSALAELEGHARALADIAKRFQRSQRLLS